MSSLHGVLNCLSFFYIFEDMRVDAPMERLHMDMSGPHPAVDGLTYICTAMYGFTKLAAEWPIRYKKAATVAKELMERVVLPLCVPRMLLTDNGREFENELCNELCRLMGIEKQKTTCYTPSAMAASKDGIPQRIRF